MELTIGIFNIEIELPLEQKEEKEEINHKKKKNLNLRNDSNSPLTISSESSLSTTTTTKRNKRNKRKNFDLNDLNESNKIQLESEIIPKRKLYLEEKANIRARKRQTQWVKEKLSLEKAIDEVFSDQIQIYEKAQALRLHFEREKYLWLTTVENKLKELQTNKQKSYHSFGEYLEFTYKEDNREDNKEDNNNVENDLENENCNKNYNTSILSQESYSDEFQYNIDIKTNNSIDNNSNSSTFLDNNDSIIQRIHLIKENDTNQNSLIKNSSNKPRILNSSKFQDPSLDLDN